MHCGCLVWEGGLDGAQACLEDLIKQIQDSVLTRKSYSL